MPLVPFRRPATHPDTGIKLSKLIARVDFISKIVISLKPKSNLFVLALLLKKQKTPPV